MDTPPFNIDPNVQFELSNPNPNVESEDDGKHFLVLVLFFLIFILCVFTNSLFTSGMGNIIYGTF